MAVPVAQPIADAEAAAAAAPKPFADANAKPEANPTFFWPGYFYGGYYPYYNYGYPNYNYGYSMFFLNLLLCSKTM